MARKRLTPEARRHQIIEAAMGLFSQKGFKGTTTKEIAAAVGISEAALFRYFPTKEELYSAIIMKAAGEVVEEGFLLEFIGKRDDLGLFRALAEDIFTRHEKDTTFLRLLYYSALEGHFLSEMFFQTRVRGRIQMLAGYIGQRIKDGAFREVEPTLTAMAFLGMVIQYLIAQEVFGLKRHYPFERKMVIESFARIFLQGLRLESVGTGG